MQQIASNFFKYVPQKMFESAILFDQSLHKWDTSKVTDMSVSLSQNHTNFIRKKYVLKSYWIASKKFDPETNWN